MASGFAATYLDSERHISNTMPDYGSFMATLKVEEGEETAATRYTSSLDYDRLCREIRAWLQENVAHILKAYPPESALAPASVRERAKNDFSTYVGAGGNAYLHWKLSGFYKMEGNKDKSASHLKKAVEAINVALSLLASDSPSKQIAFYIGNPGEAFSISLSV